jgi:hypothetical protein
MLTYWRKDNLFKKWSWEIRISTCRRQKLDPCLSLCAKTNSKQIKDLNIRTETLKLQEENVRNTFDNIGTGNAFLPPNTGVRTQGFVLTGQMLYHLIHSAKPR